MLPFHPIACSHCPRKVRRPFPIPLRLSGDLGLAVGDLHTELLGTGNNLYPLPRGDGVCDPVYPSVFQLRPNCIARLDVLSGVGLVVHEEEIQVAGVVDEESLVAGRHHVAGLDVATVADLCSQSLLALFSLLLPLFSQGPMSRSFSSMSQIHFADPSFSIARSPTHLWHSGLALEASADTVVDSLGLSP